MPNNIVKKLPYVITICEPAHTGFDKAAVLIRSGYTFSPDSIVQVFPDGVCSIVLTIGCPPDTAVKAAEEGKAEALMFEDMEFEKRVQEAAKVLVENAQRKAKEKELADLRKEQEKQIAKLQAELAK